MSTMHNKTQSKATNKWLSKHNNKTNKQNKKNKKAKQQINCQQNTIKQMQLSASQKKRKKVKQHKNTRK